MTTLNIEKMETISGGAYDWGGCAMSILTGPGIGGRMFGAWGALGGAIVGGLLDC